MRYFTIVEENTPIGFFQSKEDRDEAFKEYILKSERFATKGER